MDIKTKYSIGDTIWFMRDNKPRSEKVLEIKIDLDRVKTSIRYQWNYDNSIFVFEQHAFMSKEELLASL